MKHPITAANVSDIKFGSDGLVPVVVQDQTTGAVLMLAWANQDALEQALATGFMTYWSRSRAEIWVKGATSGNQQKLVSLSADCDQDAVLAVVQQTGVACHENTGTCWSNGNALPIANWLGTLDALCANRKANPKGRYTDQLLADPHFSASKIEEEAAEVGTVLRGQSNDDSLEHEAADLLYHLIAGLHAAGTNLDAVLRELQTR